MNNQNWVEIRKECEITDSGEYLVKRVTLELAKKKYLGLDKKDILDISIRVIGLIAIFTPIFLFYLQSRSEIKKQRALYQLEIYSSINSELHSLLNKAISKIEYQNKNDKLFFELYPKLKLINDKPIIEKFSEIKDHMALYTIMVNELVSIDSLALYFKLLTDPITTFYQNHNYPALYKPDSINFNQNFINRINLFKSSVALKQELETYSSVRKSTIDTIKKYKQLAIDILDSCKTLQMNFMFNFANVSVVDYTQFIEAISKASKEEFNLDGPELFFSGISGNLTELGLKIKGVIEIYLNYIIRLIDELEVLMTNSNTFLTG